MRVILAPGVFRPPVDDTLIIAIFRYALDGRHRVEAELQAPPALAWLETQSPRVQEEIRFAVDWSIEAEALEPSATPIIVSADQQNDWTSVPVQIRIDDLRTLLDTPFSIVLEDANSDKEFLLKMLTSEEHAFIVGQLSRGLIRIEHGGGIPNMRKQITDRARVPAHRHRTWALFDSDALRPGVPSADSELLRRACAGIPHYQLKRRYVESYLPGPSLHNWAGSGRDRDTRRARFELLGAFLRMTPEQRHHFNMKHGFAQDSKRTDAIAGDLYDSVAEKDTITLRAGFGERIRELFGGDSVTELHLRRDSGWSELRPAITELLARLR